MSEGDKQHNDNRRLEYREGTGAGEVKGSNRRHDQDDKSEDDDLINQFLNDEPETPRSGTEGQARKSTIDATKRSSGQPEAAKTRSSISGNNNSKNSARRSTSNKKKSPENSESENLHGSRKAPPPQTRPKSGNPGQNYSQALFADDPSGLQTPKKNSKKKKVAQESFDDDVSVPTDYEMDENFEIEKRREIERAARRKKNEEFLQQKKKPAKAKSRNLTKVLGTAKYNPFAFGGSVLSAVGSMGGSLRKKDTKALYGDNPMQLIFVKGFYRMLRDGEVGDDLSEGLSEGDRGRNGLSGFLNNFKERFSQKKPGSTPYTDLDLNDVDDPYSNDLSPEMQDNRNKAQPAVCACCFDVLLGKKKPEQEVPVNANKELVVQNSAPLEERDSGKPQKETNNRVSVPRKSAEGPDCAVCARKIRKRHEQTKENEVGTGETLHFHMECIKCELTREVVGGNKTLEIRNAAKPVLSDQAVEWLQQSRDAQAQLHSTGIVTRNHEYLGLVPKQYLKCVPLNVVGQDNVPALGLIPLCAKSGVMINSKDKETEAEGMTRYLRVIPTGNQLRNRFISDIKMVALGLPNKFPMKIIGSGSALTTPLSQIFEFKKDEKSLQYELRKNEKSTFSVVYNLNMKDGKEYAVKLERISCAVLLFEGELLEDVGPFLANHKIARQEQHIRTTGNAVILKGRFEHGILYEWLVQLQLNEKNNILTPVACELTLRVPQISSEEQS